MRQKPKRPPLRSQQKKQSRFTPTQLTLIKQLVVGFLSVLVVVFLGVGVWFGTRVEALTIQAVSVVGGATVTPEAVTAKVETVLNDSYFRLIPHRFAPLFPQSEIESAVKTIPRVKNVVVDTEGRRRLVVVFEEYVPAALWCESALSSYCLFLDHTGYAFTEAPNLSGSALVRYINEDKEPVVGTSTMPAAAWRTADELIERLESELNLYVTRVVIHDEVDSTYYLARGGSLKVSSRLSVDETLANFNTILQNESFAHLAAGDFHYVDLRFGDKIFVAEEEWVEPVATTTDEVVATSTAMIDPPEMSTD